ncbi:hypothetical protein ACFX2C_040122 [Malus domestica]|uniref:uncharacterized protein isoform X1 n=1 Tax=Malus domestica TaxID=3750 RepID=UPI0010AAF014|nr:uncharacterized protein LOC103420526 isoform X1 [Malus domestica]
MLPHYNSFPRHSNQAHTTGSLAPPPHQMQPQLGIRNPQIPVQFSNSNSMIALPNFMNLPNNLLPMQNNHLGMPQFGSIGPTSQPGQPNVGFFGSQGMPQFCNLVQQVNQLMSSQVPGQIFGHNMLNLQQQMNQNMGLPYGQFCLPNSMQNMNQFVPMQMQNPPQVRPNYGFPVSNQAPQTTMSQNVPLFANNRANLHSNQAGQQVNQNQQNLGLPPVQGTQLVQENKTNSSGGYNSNSNWKQSPSKSFTKNPKNHQGGFQNPQAHHMKNAKGKFSFPNGHKGKGLRNESEGKFSLANSSNQGRERKRSLFLSYTEQEIERWREERRKHYPSKSNIEKKISEKLINSEVIEREVNIRREQLKDILTKQAELGVQIAEVPSHYLADSNQGHIKEDNETLTKKGRSSNKFGKREKYDRKDRFSKRQRSHQRDSSSDPSFDKREPNKREPTLLQKLLSADIRRDRSHLLQVFRFMVTNSFFKDCPDKPLKFPTVAVKESSCDEEVAQKLSSLVEKDAFKGSDKSMVGRVYNNHSGNNNDVGNSVDSSDEDDGEGEGTERPGEEEEEIID